MDEIMNITVTGSSVYHLLCCTSSCELISFAEQQIRGNASGMGYTAKSRATDAQETEQKHCRIKTKPTN